MFFINYYSYLRTRRRPRRWSRKDPRPACDGSGRTFNTRFGEATESKATLRLRQAKRTGGSDGVCTAIRLRGDQGFAACTGRSRAATHQTRSTRAPRITYHRRDIMVDAHYAMGEQCVNEAVAFAVWLHEWLSLARTITPAARTRRRLRRSRQH